MYVVHKADESKITELARLRVKQQEEDWDTVIKDNNLYEATVEYLKNHLNKDLDVYYILDMDRITSTLAVQRLEMMPQYNDKGVYLFLCNAYTVKENRHNGCMTSLIYQVLNGIDMDSADEVWIETDNPQMIRICRDNGFEQDYLRFIKKIKKSY